KAATPGRLKSATSITNFDTRTFCSPEGTALKEHKLKPRASREQRLREHVLCVVRPHSERLNDHRLKSPSRGKRRRTHCRGKEAQVVPAKTRPHAEETILKQILMFGFFILLSSYEIDLYNYNKLYI